MRNRHNITGSEVGRPRPLYLDRTVKLGGKRGTFPWVWLLSALLVVMLILLAALWTLRT